MCVPGRPTLYKHTNNRDVAIEIIKKFYVREKRLLKLKVTWWNIGKCHAPFSMHVTQTLKISSNDWKNWEPLCDY